MPPREKKRLARIVGLLFLLFMVALLVGSFLLQGDDEADRPIGDVAARKRDASGRPEASLPPFSQGKPPESAKEKVIPPAPAPVEAQATTQATEEKPRAAEEAEEDEEKDGESDLVKVRGRVLTDDETPVVGIPLGDGKTILARTDEKGYYEGAGVSAELFTFNIMQEQGVDWGDERIAAYAAATKDLIPWDGGIVVRDGSGKAYTTEGKSHEEVSSSEEIIDFVVKPLDVSKIRQTMVIVRIPRRLMGNPDYGRLDLVEWRKTPMSGGEAVRYVSEYMNQYPSEAEVSEIPILFAWHEDFFDRLEIGRADPTYEYGKEDFDRLATGQPLVIDLTTRRPIVTGKVVDEQGQGAVVAYAYNDFNVKLLKTDGGAVTRLPLSLATNPTANYFELSGESDIPPGVYQLRVSSGEYLPSTQMLEIPAVGLPVNVEVTLTKMPSMTVEVSHANGKSLLSGVTITRWREISSKYTDGRPNYTSYHTERLIFDNEGRVTLPIMEPNVARNEDYGRAFEVREHFNVDGIQGYSGYLYRDGLSGLNSPRQLVIELQPGQTISGRTRVQWPTTFDESTRDRVRKRLRVRARREDTTKEHPETFFAELSKDGDFLMNVPVGTYTLEILLSGFAVHYDRLTKRNRRLKIAASSLPHLVSGMANVAIDAVINEE